MWDYFESRLWNYLLVELWLWDLQICGYSGPTDQRGAVMLHNQHESLQWKISVNRTSRSNHIFRCIEEGLGCFVSRDYHRKSVVFSGERLTHKCSRIGSSESSNSFFYKIQKIRFDSLTDRQHDSSVLFITHGRNPEQTFNRNLSNYIHSLSRLNIPKSPRQPQMEILPNCFETNLQSFRETIIGLVCFQTLSPTATIHSLAARPSKCSNRTGVKNFCMHFHHSQ